MLRRCTRLSTRQTEVSESTTPTVSSSAGQAGDSINPPPVNDADITVQEEITTTTKAPKRKRQTKKQAEIGTNTNTRPQDDNENGENEFTTGEGSSGTGAKKEAHSNKKNKKVASPTVAPTLATSTSTQSEKEEASIGGDPINKSDPCAVLPTETWHRILSYLPLSKIAQTSSVSKAWLDGSRTSPIWKTICEMDSGTNESESNIWMLCFECRRKHYDDTPEALHADAIGDEHIFHEDTTQMVAKTGACKTYSLTEEDLKGLDYVIRPNPHHYSGLPMRLFERDQVQQLALRTHAGWVGINAVRDGVARSRLTHFNQRAKEVQAGSRAQSSQ
ncbi:hypothetical protein BG015_003367 [Linnemannia schmuckeri]|uniref:F-box domain-containing protein n=1 Tax=Linnemannia schmuckeri TaxID=64567 RepID=A0A9P5V4B4_9FUNG|nr:hypothetical protein BG015_003367 [Linnemannia schmuckeri]